MSAIKVKPACKFFKDGYCSKGQYCEFSHEALAADCKRFLAGFCKYGNSCAFKHTIKQPLPSNKALCAQPLPPFRDTSRSTGPESCDKIKAEEVLVTSDKINNNVTNLSKPTIEELWGLEPDPWNAQSSTQTVTISANSYAAAVGKDLIGNFAELDISKPLESSASGPKPLCQFFVLGNCKFGTTCRNRHDFGFELSQEDIVPVLTNRAECGICMCYPRDGVFGVLSHCECVFCLSCVREWRKDGTAVTNSSKQVRLCPLCRRESFYVVPSMHPVVGEDKKLFLKAYRESMAAKVCQVRRVAELMV